MGNGPFTSYVGPNVFTRTKTERTLPSLLAGVRLPCLVGPSREYNEAKNVEIVRGSSGRVDILRVGENVSSQLTGTNRNFFVTHTPIVTGEGIGETTYDPNDVKVTVNGEQVSVLSVNGETGEITLVEAPKATDIVLVDYYFNRKDTLVTDEDISNQADGSNKIFYVAHRPIVDGTDNGIITNNPNKVTVKVNGSPVTVEEVVGEDGKVVLKDAPGASDTVTITYYYNTWRETFDYLPDKNVSEILKVGDSPGRADYSAKEDFVLLVNEDGVSTLHWGNTTKLTIKSHTDGKEYLDETQITATPVGEKIYMEVASGAVDGVNKEFTVSNVITEGNGTGKPTNDPALVQVYVGTTVSGAISAGQVDLAYIKGDEKKIVLKNAPVAGNVYVNYWTSRFGDGDYDIEVVTEGGPGVGEYKITPLQADFVSSIEEGTHNVTDPDFATEGIRFLTQPRTMPGYSVSETITLTFTNDHEFTVSSDKGADGSSGSGELGRTYFDNKTGVRFTIDFGVNVDYQAGDTLQFVVTQNPTFKAGASINRCIPSLNLVVSDLTNTGVGDVTTLSLYEKSGKEPNVGDFYYVDYKYDKSEDDFKAKVFFREDLDEIFAIYGEVSVDNKLSLGAWLAINNGAPGIILKQVPRAEGSNEPAYQSWEEALLELEKPVEGNYRPKVLVPLTTDDDVIALFKKHCERQSSMRYRQERICFFGFPVGTDYKTVREKVEGTFRSERMTALYPDGAILGIVDEYGNEVEHIVDGSFLACAYAGVDTNPAYTVADPNTRRQIVGFKRFTRTLSEVEMDEVAAVGVTVIEDLDPVMRVRHARTTRADDPLLVEQNIVEIADLVQELTRINLDRFIGIKYLPKVNEEISATVSAMFDRLIQAEYITDYRNVKVETDPNAPDIARVSAEYRPVFALNWIVVTYTLRARL